MSVVTNIVLNVGALDGIAFRTLQSALHDAGIGELGDLTESFSDPPGRERRWGGTKYPEVSLYGGAYNHLDLGRFLDLARKIRWEHPDDLQCLVKDQETFRFRVLELVDGSWVELRRPESRREPESA